MHKALPPAFRPAAPSAREDTRALQRCPIDGCDEVNAVDVDAVEAGVVGEEEVHAGGGCAGQ